MEAVYERAVKGILSPIVGDDGLSVKVNAELDFTQVESTVESYDAEDPALISESLSSNESTGALNGGVPGSLTNQPPANGTVAVDEIVEGEVVTLPSSRNNTSTRNFEVDRTIDYIRQAAGTVNRLSVAVVIDDRVEIGDGGERVRVGRSDEEMERLTSLVREAVGFDANRGDTLQVTNFPFRELEELPPGEPVPFWQLPWVWDIARYLAAGIGILLLVTMVLRPVLKNLAAVPAPRQALALQSAGGGASPAEALSAAPVEPNVSAAADAALGRARKVAEEDPRLVAQVVKRWINDDGN
jgi:flagellar M-ring protein FliF